MNLPSFVSSLSSTIFFSWSVTTWPSTEISAARSSIEVGMGLGLMTAVVLLAIGMLTGADCLLEVRSFLTFPPSIPQNLYRIWENFSFLDAHLLNAGTTTR